MQVRDEPLQRADRDGFVDIAAAAFGLARGSADAPAQNVFLKKSIFFDRAKRVCPILPVLAFLDLATTGSQKFTDGMCQIRDSIEALYP